MVGIRKNGKRESRRPTFWKARAAEASDRTSVSLHFQRSSYHLFGPLLSEKKISIAPNELLNISLRVQLRIFSDTGSFFLPSRSQAGLVPPNVFYKGMFRPAITTETSTTSSSSSRSSSSVVEPSTTPIEQRTVPPEQVLDSTNSNTSDADEVGRESLKTMDQAS